MQFHIDTMTCSGCARSVTQAIRGVDPSARVVADPEARRVEIDSRHPRAAFEAALSEAGFPPASAA